MRARPLEFDVDRCVVQLKLSKDNLFKGWGDAGCGNGSLLRPDRIRFQELPESSEKESRCGPRLGRTGREIERGSRSDAFTKAADQLWQLPQSM